MIKLLKKNLIKVGSTSKNKDEILNEIADMVAKVSKNVTSKAIYSALLQREELSSTGLGSFLAIPHCAFEVIDDYYVGLIISAGVDFDSIDGEPAKLIFFSIGPKSEQSQHIATLTSISKIAMDRDLLDRVINSTSEDEVFSLLNKEDEVVIETTQEVLEPKTVKKKGFFKKFLTK